MGLLQRGALHRRVQGKTRVAREKYKLTMPDSDFESHICEMLLRSGTRGALVTTRLDRRGKIHEQSRVPRCDRRGKRLDDKLPPHVPLEQRLLLPEQKTHGLRLVLARRTRRTQIIPFPSNQKAVPTNLFYHRSTSTATSTMTSSASCATTT